MRPTDASNPLLASTQIKRWRRPAPIAVLFLVVLQQVFLSLVIPRVSSGWQLPLQLQVSEANRELELTIIDK